MNIPSLPHPSLEILKQFAIGRLSRGESDPVLSHLAACETCLQIVDKIWGEPMIGPDVSQSTALDKETAKRIEDRLTQRIRRSNLSGSLVRLGTAGFMKSAVGLLRPFAIRKK